MGPIKTLRSRSGDTLVEVMASIFIFLLMMGILQGAVSYSSASMRKNQEIRQENAEILKELSTAQAALRDDGQPGDLAFRAGNADFTQMGSATGFTVEVELYQKKAKDVSFLLYHPPEKSDASGSDEDGGDTP